jgi:hypothetical protein
LTVRSHKTSYYLIEVVSMAGLTVRSHKTSDANKFTNK